MGLAGDELDGWIRRRLEPPLADWLSASVGGSGEPGRPEENGVGRAPPPGRARSRAAVAHGPRGRALGGACLARPRRVARRAGTRAGAGALPRSSRPARRPTTLGRRPAEQLVRAARRPHGDGIGDAARPAGSDRRLEPQARERILAVAEGTLCSSSSCSQPRWKARSTRYPTRSRRCSPRGSTGSTTRDRSTLQAAAICGTSFTTEEVAELVEADPSASLLTLVRRELVRPGEADDPGGAGWSFGTA